MSGPTPYARWDALAASFNVAHEEYTEQYGPVDLAITTLSTTVNTLLAVGWRKRTIYSGLTIRLLNARCSGAKAFRPGLIMAFGMVEPPKQFVDEGFQRFEIPCSDSISMTKLVDEVVDPTHDYFRVIMGCSYTESIALISGAEIPSIDEVVDSPIPVRAIERIADWGDWYASTLTQAWDK